ncbi:MAG: RNA polymerase sigma factor [Planctomycetes bacterium]|nr:RNA polymerase sigma factor [Planctomycetota bacterium]
MERPGGVMDSSDTSQDRGVTLMLAFQRGDESAFDAIVTEYQAPVYGVLRRILGPAAAVDDLAQEAFIRLYRAKDRYQPHGRLATFLYRIAYNLALNHIRDRGRKPEVSMPMSAEGESIPLEDEKIQSPDAPVGDKDWAKLVQTALLGLPENQRAALVFQHFDGLDLEEIGQLLGISPKAAKSLCHRARENLRQLLAPFREAEHD